MRTDWRRLWRSRDDVDSNADSLELEVGDRVRDRNNVNDVGTVESVLDNDRVLVRFDEMLWDGITDYVYPTSELEKIDDST